MDEVGWIVGGVLVFFAMLIGGATWSDHMTHTEKMECMKLRGDWVANKACIFREQKPQ